MTSTQVSSNKNEYINPVFENDITTNDVTKNDVTKNDVTKNDVTTDNVYVTIEETSFTEQANQLQVNDDARFRKTAPSISLSINYDDVISAEQLTENIAIKDGVTPACRRSSASVDQNSSHDTTAEDEEEIFHQELILKIRKTLPLKNFRDEIRARRDLEKFLVSPVVLLDVNSTGFERIIGSLLTKLQKDLEVDEKITSEAAKAFFTFEDKHKSSANSVDHLRETIQGIQYKPEGAMYEQSWITALCSLPNLKRSHVGIARLRHPLNLGSKSEEVLFVIAVIAPKKEKFTKNAVEIGRTFSSLMMNSSFRHRLAEAATEEDFKKILARQSSKYKKEQCDSVSLDTTVQLEESVSDYSFKQFGKGVYDDFKRRIPYYWSDFRDGVVGKHTLHKLAATVFFLYFACLLPDIAFGSLYQSNTNGKIDVTSCIISQTIGGLSFAFISGQPMLVLLTTAPLALYVKVIMLISETFHIDFPSMYAMTGLWNSIFLVLQAFLNLSKYMKYSTRSTEEIFGFFIAMAFTGDAVKATAENFYKNYNFRSDFINYSESLSATSLTTMIAPNGVDSFSPTIASNVTAIVSNVTFDSSDCIHDETGKEICFRPENSILFLLLMLGTLWLGMTLLRFDESPFLSSTKREILADYALAISVLVLSFVGSFLFQQISLEQFKYNPDKQYFVLPDISLLPPLAHLGAVGLGLCLSCLFYVDQNVSAALVNNPQNKLKKGPAYHWDLMVIGLINVPFSIFTLPWVHAALPHSPLHVKALADVEQHVSNVGTVHDEIVKVRETRLTTILSHILIGLSLLIIPVLQYVPIAVLQGLFLYLGLTSFIGNQMFDRLILIFTEGSSYPPNHYVRKVPQRKLNLFTICQFCQLAVVAVIGFVDFFYLKMIFPVIILLLLPLRHKILPKIVANKYLKVLDS